MWRSLGAARNWDVMCDEVIAPIARIERSKRVEALLRQAQRLRSQFVLVVPTVLAIGAGLAGLLYAPLGGAVAWALILGAGQNAALALAIFFTAARSPSPAAWHASR